MSSSRTAMVLALMVLCLGSIHATEINPTEVAANLAKYRDANVVHRCDAEMFEKVIRSISQLPETERKKAESNTIKYILSSLIPVKDREKKLILLLERIENSTIQFDRNILPLLLRLISSQEDEVVFQKALNILVQRAYISFNIDEQRIYIVIPQ